MRELTEYEKGRWYDEDQFTAPEFVGYGDEAGEYYDVFVEAERAAHYAHNNDELVPLLQIEILEYYYANLAGIYTEGWSDPDEQGLPSYELVKQQVLIYQKDHDEDLSGLMALDWAMEWREEHKEETNRNLRIERLKHELSALEKQL